MAACGQVCCIITRTLLHRKVSDKIPRSPASKRSSWKSISLSVNQGMRNTKYLNIHTCTTGLCLWRSAHAGRRRLRGSLSEGRLSKVIRNETLCCLSWGTPMTAMYCLLAERASAILVPRLLRPWNTGCFSVQQQLRGSGCSRMYWPHPTNYCFSRF